MHFSRFVLFFFFLPLLSLSAHAQQALTSADTGAVDQRALTLMQSSLSALIGSATAVPATIAASGTLSPVWDPSSSPYSIRVYVSGTDKLRWEADLPQGTTASVINRLSAQLQSSSATTTLMPWEVSGKKLENFPILLLSRWLASNRVQLRFVGVESVSGQTLNHISVVDLSQKPAFPNRWHRDENRGEYELYLDPVTSLPVRLHYYQDTNDTYFYVLAPFDIVYSDFHLFGGSVFPSTLTRYMGTKEISIIQLESVQLNILVSDQSFALE